MLVIAKRMQVFRPPAYTCTHIGVGSLYAGE